MDDEKTEPRVEQRTLETQNIVHQDGRSVRGLERRAAIINRILSSPEPLEVHHLIQWVCRADGVCIVTARRDIEQLKGEPRIHFRRGSSYVHARSQCNERCGVTYLELDVEVLAAEQNRRILEAIQQ